MRRLGDALILALVQAGVAAIAVITVLIAFAIAWNLGGAILRALGDLLPAQNWLDRFGSGWLGVIVTVVFLLAVLIGFAKGAYEGWTLRPGRN
ncbi:hypothetical protein AYO48_03635 [Gaiella sp. SCGC AG-212-M14]|nr:hypothetical protein AYO48_03635 [Gaiella sp. SCGC AG-212-M14]